MGSITTARGELLDLDGLKAQATLPLVKAKQTKTQVKRKVFSKRKPLNVRGFQPAQGEHILQQEPVKIVPDEIPQKSSFSNTGEAQTAADITGVKVKVTEGAISRAKERAGIVDDDGAMQAEAVSEEALGEILGGLEAANPNAQSAADAEEKKTTRRSRAKKS
jgi:hypothetical protein